MAPGETTPAEIAVQNWDSRRNTAIPFQKAHKMPSAGHSNSTYTSEYKDEGEYVVVSTTDLM